MWSRTRGWKGTHWNVTCICTTAALLQKHKTAELGLKKVHPEQYLTRSKQWSRIAVREAALPWPPALTCARWVSSPGCSPSVPQFWMRFPSKNLPWPFCQCLHYLQVNPTLHEILIVLSPFPTSCVSPRQKNASAIHWNSSSESPSTRSLTASPALLFPRYRRSVPLLSPESEPSFTPLFGKNPISFFPTRTSLSSRAVWHTSHSQ